MNPSEPKRFKPSQNFDNPKNSPFPQKHSDPNFRNNRGRGGGGRGRGRGRGRGHQFKNNSGQNQTGNNYHGADSPNNRGRGNFRDFRGRGRGNRGRPNEPKKQQPEPFLKRPVEQVCGKFLKGRCFEDKEEKCHLGHFIKPVKKTRCKFWIQKMCKRGDDCDYSHNVPCKYFHLYNRCSDGANCYFSHEPLTDFGRNLFIKELNLDLPPKILHHDFKVPHGKTTGNNQTETNPLSLTIQVPRTVPTQSTESVTDSETKSVATESNPAENLPPPVFKLSGFYKDTLDSDEEDKEEQEAEPAHAETVPPPSENSPLSNPAEEVEETEIINAEYDLDLEWNLRRIYNRSVTNYFTIRKAVLPAYTLIDPRLSLVPRTRQPKSIQELKEVFPDVLAPGSIGTDDIPESPEPLSIA